MTGSLYPLTKIFPFPSALRPWQPPWHSLFLWVKKIFFLYSTSKWDHSVLVFHLFDLFHWTSCPQCPSMLSQWQAFHLFFGWITCHCMYVRVCVCVWLCYHVLCMYSSISWHIGCLPVLTVVNNAIVNIGVQIPFQGRGFVESWSGIARSCDSSSFNFLRNLHIFHSGCAFPPAVHKHSLAFPSSSACVLSFEESRSDRYEAIGNCGFGLHFPED